MSFLTKELTLPKLRAPQLRAPDVSRRKARSASVSRTRGAAVTGLEIGATQAIAAEAQVTDGMIVAHRVAARPLPAGLVHDGVVTNPEALAHELRGLFSEHKLGKRVRVGLATPRTILRVIDLPPLDEADIRIALPLHARDRIPMPLESAVLDHQTIGLVDTPEGQRLRVIVVATERTGVDALLTSLRHAGLRPEGIDLSVFAAMRAVAPPNPSAGPVLHAQLGDLVNIAIADAGVCHFTRQAPQGLALVLERLTEQCDFSADEALKMLNLVSGEATGEETGEVERTAAREVGMVLGRVADELGSELRAAADFFGTQSDATVTAGVITGTLAPLRGFVEALGDASGLDLHCGTVNVSGAEAVGTIDRSVAPVAVGLAIGALPR